MAEVAPSPEIVLKRLFDAQFHQLVLSSFGYVKDYDQAQDIVQDTFVKVWQQYDRVKEVKDLKGYLFRAVRNSSMNFLRHVEVREKFVDEAKSLGEENASSPEEELSKEATLNKVHEAVNQLPEPWKEAFILSKYNRLKYHEIAEEMGVSPKTVEKYMSKSLQFLRKELKDLFWIGLVLLDRFFDV